MKYLKFVLVLLVSVASGGSPVNLAAKDADALARYRQSRRQVAERPFRVILNNDGCDALYYPGNLAVTRENFLSLRTSPLLGSGITTLSYCSQSSGFSYFTQETKVGTVMLGSNPENDPAKNYNATGKMLEQGYDPIQCVIDFAKTNNYETLWSFRMNDTHDASEKNAFLFPPLKEQHPGWLVGKKGQRGLFGAWSSVDYARKGITDMAFRLTEEVCLEREIDGVELDFCRHLCNFKTVAEGGVATESELESMNNLLRRIRGMTEEVGMRRGKPILVYVRVPDDPGYAKCIGLDIETWMQENLADVYIGSDYFQLRPWKDWAELGKKHDAIVYAGLSESRVLGEDKRFRRGSTECYDARIAGAWHAGLHGLYIFNVFNPRTPFFRTCGDLGLLRNKNKLYFATVRDGDPNRYLKDGARFRRMPVLVPRKGHRLPEGDKPFLIPLNLAEDVSPETKVRISAHCRVPGPLDPGSLVFEVNGETVDDITRNGEWLDVALEKEQVRLGDNVFSLRVREGKGGVLEDFVVQFSYN